MAIDTGKYRPRALDLLGAMGPKSLFLFGPRQTGKSTLVTHTLADVVLYTLLDSDTYLRLSRRPALLREELAPDFRGPSEGPLGSGNKFPIASPPNASLRSVSADLRSPEDCPRVVIDEIQKLPMLLDEVHLLIEQRGTRFLLTGSSARKLRRGGVNLLGGRARSRTLHPFVASELGEDFDLLRALNWGLVPSIYLSDSPAEDIKAYVGDYLTQEVAAEGLTRNVPAFSRFLEVAAQCSGQMLNHATVASDAQVPRSTVQEYFRILYDTLVAFELPAWKQTTKRKPIVTSKFYLFDGGVARYLQRAGKIRRRSPQLGAAFESYIFHELRTYVDYRTIDCPLAYWRSKSGFEVDFILGDRVAIEVKGKEHVGERDLKGLRALREEDALDEYVVVTMEQRPRRVDGIELLPWRTFVERLWSDAW